MSGRIVALALALLLAGCQPLPHPFEDDRPAPHAPIVSLLDTTTVAVAPVEGLGPEASEQLAGAMADALQSLDVLASAQSASRGSVSLRGTARPAGASVSIDWQLVDPKGQALGQATGSAPISLAAVNRGDAGALSALASAAAPALAKLLQDDMPPPGKPLPSLREVVVLPIAGAPGDGRDALKLAMSAALTLAKLTVLPGQGTGDTLSVAGTVKIDKPQNGQQHIAITWALLQADGSQLGVVSQENAVPQGSLDRKWGEVANLVAQAATPGILALIQKAEQVRSGS